MSLLTDMHVYVEKRDVYEYPDGSDFYSPSEKYPEYPFYHIARQKNSVYDMVRACLVGMQLDLLHYNTPEWNPLGDIIKPGDVVALKPNLVIHKHLRNPEFGLNALITHPSITRVVADYCMIALRGVGSLIIGDAPVQSCNWDKLIEASGYNTLLNFYKMYELILLPKTDQKIIFPVKLMDFRLTQSGNRRVFGIDVIYNKIKKSCSTEDYVAVNIGKDSALMEKIEKYNQFRITNYDPSEMIKHHNSNINEYLISQVILNADVVINLPKPKTHRKAGITAAMKNIIGINGHKDWLPHHTKGSVYEYGDEYLNKSTLKRYHTNAIEKSDIAGINGNLARAAFWKYAAKFMFKIIKITKNNMHSEGSWWGNDTIWRTICDINRILIYADKNGNMCKTPQRKCFQIGDIIISGEGEGPLSPTPKKVGVVAAAHNPLAFDTAICALMGFDVEKIKSINNAYLLKHYPISQFAENHVRLISNVIEINNIEWRSIKRAESWKYVAANGWRGHIELI